MAGRKRKAEAARVAEEEADRALYGAFRGAANSLSQLYALAGGHQRVSFHAGERHALVRRAKIPSRPSSPSSVRRPPKAPAPPRLRVRPLAGRRGRRAAPRRSILAPPTCLGEVLEKLYQWMVLQHESGLRLTVSDIASHIQHEIEYGGDNALTSPRSQYMIQNLQAPMQHIPNTSTQQPPSCSITSNPSKDSMIFSKALSSPVRQNLQLYHVQQGGDTGCFADGIFCTGNRDSDPAASNDSSVDMHSDSPGHDS